MSITLGLELEFFTVDAKTFVPINCHPIFKAHPIEKELIDHELACEQIEIKSSPSTSLQAIEKEISFKLEHIAKFLLRYNICLLPLSLQDRFPLTIFPSAKYAYLLSLLGENFYHFGPRIAADQINIGVLESKHAWSVYNSILLMLPHLMALSNSSPLYLGRPNGTASNRLDAYDLATAQLPKLRGFPPLIQSRECYEAMLAEEPTAGVPSFNFHYVRPRLDRNVVAEIRCLDKQPTIHDTMALLALAKAVALSALCNPHFPSVDELQEAQALFIQARKKGISDLNALKKKLNYYRNYLPQTELAYFDFLYEKAENPLTHQILKIFSKGGLPALFHTLTTHLMR